MKRRWAGPLPASPARGGGDGARWYDPLIGRFTQADTIIPDPASPQAFNRYAYTLNNPLRYVDPSGHAYWGEDGYDDADEWVPPGGGNKPPKNGNGNGGNDRGWINLVGNR